jgi:ornithine carbamoyltransferase
MNGPVMNIARQKDFLDLSLFETATLDAILKEAIARKKARAGRAHGMADDDCPLKGRVLAMIFDKQSTRTRISFDIAMRQLGGTTLMLTGNEMQLAREETIADTARVLSRYVDAVMIRLLDHEMVEELAVNATIPVINGLTKWSHPCQALTDLFTIHEHVGDLRGQALAFVGDGNNVYHSLALLGATLGLEVRLAHPDGYGPNERIVARARELAAESGGRLVFARDPREVVRGAAAIYTDAWTSMGQEAEAEERREAFRGYTVDAALVGLAPDAVVMHCLPAHRGEEITSDVMDGPQSVIFEQSENRLHAQKAFLVESLAGA